MPRGGARVGSGRKRKTVELEPVGAGISTGPEDGQVENGTADRKLPLEYMLDLINDPTVDDSRRDRLAVAAAPYCHPKIGEGGKKEQKQGAAEKASKGKFAPAAPPRLVSSR